MRDTQRQSQRHRQREKQAPCREPTVGLDPGSPRSSPGPKAVLNCWAPRAAQFLKPFYQGRLGGSVLKRQPSAQGVILESRDRVLHWAACMEPASPSAYVSASLSLSVSWINKIFKKVIKCLFCANHRTTCLVPLLHSYNNHINHHFSSCFNCTLR